MVLTSDIFLKEDLTKLFHNKFIVVIGDSNQRSVYKDLVMLLQKNSYISDRQLRLKGEYHYENDELIEGGRRGKMVNGVNYREVRQYQSTTHLVRFYFVTRCYNTYMESILADFTSDPKPDVIIMNSCLWDISRYGRNGVDEYKANLKKLFSRFREILNEETLVIWNATLPISKTARGGFIVPGIEFMNNTLRLDVLEANFYARQIVASHGYDLLDLHYHLRDQLHRRADDGIHWDKTAHRRITNLILTHIADAWRERKPRRAQNVRHRDSDDEKEEGKENYRDWGEMEVNSLAIAEKYDRNGNLTNAKSLIKEVRGTDIELDNAQNRHNGNFDNTKPCLNLEHSNPNRNPEHLNPNLNRDPRIKRNPICVQHPVKIPAPLLIDDGLLQTPRPSINHTLRRLNNFNVGVVSPPAFEPYSPPMTRTVGFLPSLPATNYTVTRIPSHMTYMNPDQPVHHQTYTNFNWQPYARDDFLPVNRNLNRRHFVRDNPYGSRFLDDY